MKHLLALLVVLFPLSALAVNDWGYSGCDSNGSTLGAGGKICFDVNTSFASPYTTPFYVKAADALACLTPKIGTVGTADATARVWYCPNGGSTLAACNVEVCATASCTLDGGNAIPATQTACVELGTGNYIVEFAVRPAGADIGLFSVQGSN